jgi:hypothetical protein
MSFLSLPDLQYVKFIFWLSAVISHLGGGVIAGGLHRLPKIMSHSSARRSFRQNHRRYLSSSSVSETLAAYGLGQVLPF